MCALAIIIHQTENKLKTENTEKKRKKEKGKKKTLDECLIFDTTRN